MIQEFDIVITGSSMVGLALACGLEGSSFRVAIIESKVPTTIQPIQSTPKITAINVASRKLLQHVRVWENIAHHANSYQRIEVWEQDSFGSIFFDSTELGHAQLGYIVETSTIRQALWQRADQMENITLLVPSKLSQIVWRKKNALLILNNGHILTAQLVVATDGSFSWLRQQVGIPLIFWDYQHHALVATIRTEKPHGNIARQVFGGDSILAVLPLSDPYLSFIVWSLTPEIAQQHLIQPVEIFNQNLAICFRLTLGLCSLQGERKIFPLVGQYARHFSSHRLVIIGDASHTLHPLEGKGINLGFMDVIMLLEELHRLKKIDQDIGSYPNLRRYECTRKFSAALMFIGMQGFQELFSGHNPIKKWIRHKGLSLVHTLPSVKSFFIRQVMGLNSLPNWLVEEFFD